MIQQPPETHLAQFNVARALDDLESDRLRDFMSALDRVNAVAEQSPGFVWRLQDDTGDATNIRAMDDPRLIVNLSVWETPETFERFVWKTVHKRVYEKRSKWFAQPDQAHFVMWWVPAGHIPTVEEARERLAHLTSHGESPTAFTLRGAYPPPVGTPSADVAAD